jgi:hypothetical protein
MQEPPLARGLLRLRGRGRGAETSPNQPSGWKSPKVTHSTALCARIWARVGASGLAGALSLVLETRHVERRRSDAPGRAPRQRWVGRLALLLSAVCCRALEVWCGGSGDPSRPRAGSGAAVRLRSSPNRFDHSRRYRIDRGFYRLPSRRARSVR